MLKNAMFFSLAALSNSIFAASVDLYDAPLTSVQAYVKAGTGTNGSRNLANQVNVLQAISTTQGPNATMIRYQQRYYGIPVIGSQVIISKQTVQGRSVQGSEEVSGHLASGIKLNPKPQLSAQQAIDIAKTNYFSYSQASTQGEKAVLQIREEKASFVLTYLVSLKSIDAEGNPSMPFYIINAQTGAILKQWDNIQHYADFGPGGNVKTKQYTYGKNGLPALSVIKQGSICTMDSPAVRLVNLGHKWDYYDAILSPYKYLCGKNKGDPIHGAYSPANDAYYFGHVIVAMYAQWYKLPVLRGSRGQPGKLLMRVHFGQQYDNAFWDGTSMSFGDGLQFYPLVALDIAGHEVTHGFTQQNAGLEYHDQSGALNEAMSDMAGQATRVYLLSTLPLFYKKLYLGQSTLTWGIGETITPPGMGTALRYMNNPSADGSSADCLSQPLANSSGSSCLRTYADVVAYAEANLEPNNQQSYIVHQASGVFNKAFYLLSNQFGTRVAYKIMLQANMKYWTPTTNFTSGACGVLHATKDYKLNTNVVRTVFNKVGINTTSCHL
ncbi:M4 family metallopeptidase [Legionella sp. km772]|uniref:M4 family metallopeptidase n=1 Tax=Legionella sp. km772 TaxID=2498111 RepID=UPI000F8DA342|nr:M4 family metallopeptidase [Legionella sp. km772]RUR12720.1 peptidase M4 family protein [Legionella sp. km772]